MSPGYKLNADQNKPIIKRYEAEIGQKTTIILSRSSWLRLGCVPNGKGVRLHVGAFGTENMWDESQVREMTPEEFAAHKNPNCRIAK